MTKKLWHIINVLFFIVFPLMGWCQDANTPQEAYSCERPQFMDIKDRHRNCRDMYNRKMGLWKTYSYSRVLIAETNYDNDKKHGLCKRYYPHTGALMESCEYHYGVRDGEFKNFYYSGTPKTEGNYVMGKMDGMWTKFFLAGGEVASEGMYSKGKKVGLWKFYNSKGELVKTIGYGREGEVTSVNGQNVEPGTVIIPSDIQPGQLSKNPNQKTPGSSPKISGSVVPNGSGTGSHDTQAPPKGKPKIK